ncbi:hypothetical protein C810_02522 [Lachnospiraceae bacterium A2]|nr:hypothetical protein C810_02522 [Lachnospiraceae bacterium A2]
MKKIISAGTLLSALLLLTAAITLSKPPAVILPAPGNIVQIQLDTVKIDAESFGKAQLEEFLENMETLMPVTKLESMQVSRPKQDFILSFVEKDGGRKSFQFFCADGICYMETDQGDLYKNADFMEGYLTAKNGWFPVPRGLETLSATNAEALMCALDTGYDTRYWLYCTVQKKIAEGYPEPEIMESAKAELLWQYRIYQYASENGYGIPDDSYEELTAERIRAAKGQKNDSAEGQEYKNCGTTLEEHIQQSAKGFFRISDTVDYLRFCFQEEFRKEGKDTVDGKTYRMAGDYSNARMNQVILSECNSIDTTEFEKTLEEAEMYLNSKYKN